MEVLVGETIKKLRSSIDS